MKRLIVCMDGTWNKKNQRENGIPTPTNVAKIYNILKPISKDGIKQRKYYHSGAGTENSIVEKIAGGAVGADIDRHIRNAYRWLSAHYQEGDEIYLFGFSRGAYSARSLAGMIYKCGLLKQKSNSPKDKDQLWIDVKRVYNECYRKQKKLKFSDLLYHKESIIHTPNGTIEAIPIKFIGVWDSVGALGVPDRMAMANLLDKPSNYSFHDMSLHPNIITARHALALDEMRSSFSPVLWKYTENKELLKDRDIQEIWFAGVHADIGGGYAQSGLSDIALEWMIKEAQKCGLEIQQERISHIHPDPAGVLHDSIDGLFKLMTSTPRNIPAVTEDNKEIHPSVIARQKNPPLYEDNYKETIILKKKNETSLPRYIFAYNPWNYTGVYLQEGVEYLFEASGKWLNGDDIFTPDGKSENIKLLSKAKYAFGSLSGAIEGLYKHITKNKHGDFNFSKRYEEYPWFSLVGVVADGGNPMPDGTPPKHTSFLIGTKRVFKPKKSGYLYAFANDAWGFYNNNHGAIKLRVTRVS